ncbi:MAG: glucosaminidase domain-containing protein [Bacteroidetes bacterium]|nr:glucosaminidase domain-containing protein [Bacteroidota bacterium]
MKNIFLLIVLFSSTIALSNGLALKKEYVEKFKQIAIQQMLEFRIPASITLAQGILESGIGASPLAVKGNNHFGIKCTDWTGDRMFQDDDKKGECFRVYKNAEESFKDHSLFLKNRERYAGLFELEVTDYKAWAKGLKKAGYATDPNYPNRLITIIEELNLDELDAAAAAPKDRNKAKDQKEIAPKKSDKSSPNKKVKAEKTAVIQSTQNHQIKTQNKRTQYIIAKKGDTFYRISLEFDMHVWELRRYNDFGPRKDVLEPGDIVYLTPKKTKSSKKSEVKVSSNDTSLWSIAQVEGIRLKSLEKKNPDLTLEDNLPIGTQVKLK